MIPTDLGHGRGWLDRPAALSIVRVDAALGHPLQITDAGRTNAEQWDMWRKYGWPRAAYPGTSTHETGLAIDTDERIALLGEHGWTRPFNNPARKPYEPWHYKYVQANDRHLHDPNPTTINKKSTPRRQTMLHAAYRTDDGSIIIQDKPDSQLRGLGPVEWRGILAANPGISAAQITNGERDGLIAAHGITWPK